MQINSDQEHQDTLAQIEVLMDAKEGTPEAEELERLAIAVEQYEDIHYPIANTCSEDFWKNSKK